MCGIVGFITAEKGIGAQERKRWFINALRAGVVRGDDGTGMFMVKHGQQGTADWAKIGAAAEEFLACDQAEMCLGVGKNFDDYRAVIGHNRSATIGSVNTANAHPFQEGPITLVHNGTLNTTHGMPTPKHKMKGVDVDSHVICHNLATHDVPDVVKELDGAYVLVWHDARDGSVNIIRNSQRPLHILQLKHHDTLLLASEAEMLWWLTKRASFTPMDEIYYPEPGYWLQFLPDKGIKPKVTKLEMHSWGKGSRSYGGYWDEDYSPWHSRSPTGFSGRRSEGTDMGKAERPKLDGPHIQQSALNRKIPRPLTATLDTVGLHHLDKLRMRVITVLPVHGTKHAVVTGRLVDLHEMLTANIYGLLYDAVKGAEGKETWTVAPNGVKIGAGGSRLVLARLLSRSSESRQDQSAMSPSSDSSQEEETTSTDGEWNDSDAWDKMTQEERAKFLENEVFYGPDGDEITFLDWALLVQGGCICCSKQIDPLFAEEVLWEIGAPPKPICGECAEELAEAGELDVDYSEAS